MTDDLEIPPFLRRKPEGGANDMTQQTPEQTPPPPGHNSSPTLLAGTRDRLLAIVARMENLQDQKDDIAEDMKAVMQDAKAEGFDTQAIRHLLKVRRMKPHERAERDAVNETYLHAAGLAQEPPLHRALRAAMLDEASQEALIESFKKFVPSDGQIIIQVGGGKAKRLWRDKDEEVHVEDWTGKKRPKDDDDDAPGATVPVNKGDVPDCTEDEAYELGKKHCRENLPIVSNPFRFGDARRARFDDGWCSVSGTDGMGRPEPEPEPETPEEREARLLEETDAQEAEEAEEAGESQDASDGFISEDDQGE